MEELAIKYSNTGNYYADHKPKSEIIAQLRGCNDEDIIEFLEELRTIASDAGYEYAQEYE